jgi:hypothetical protein
MDDAFSMVAARMPRSPRVTPFTIRVTVMLAVVTALLTMFTMFVVGQQRAADERRASLAARQQAGRAAESQATAQELAAGPGATQPSPGAVEDLLDARAREAAVTASEAAIRLAATSSLDQAQPSALSSVNHELVFIDGPSTAPSVVSVYAGSAGWAAAVRGDEHTCFWIAVTPGGRTRYGTGRPCTGMAALAADRPRW